MRCSKPAASSVNHLISLDKQRGRDSESKRLGSLEVEHDAEDLEDDVAHMLQEINRIAETYNCCLPDCDEQDEVTGRSW